MMRYPHRNNAMLKRADDAVEVSRPAIRLRQVRKHSGKGTLDDELPSGSGENASFRIRILYLQKIKRTEWTTKQFRGLGSGLFEIKWTSEKVECRAMGFDDREGFFVIVKVCSHKQRVYSPHDCIDRARQIKASVEKGELKVIEYEL